MKIFCVWALLTTTAALAASPALPNPALRLQFFERAGLADQLQGLDQLDQDLLYLRAHTRTLAELRAAYPGLHFEGLAVLRAKGGL